MMKNYLEYLKILDYTIVSSVRAQHPEPSLSMNQNREVIVIYTVKKYSGDAVKVYEEHNKVSKFEFYHNKKLQLILTREQFDEMYKDIIRCHKLKIIL